MPNKTSTLFKKDASFNLTERFSFKKKNKEKQFAKKILPYKISLIKIQWIALFVWSINLLFTPFPRFNSLLYSRVVSGGLVAFLVVTWNKNKKNFKKQSSTNFYNCNLIMFLKAYVLVKQPHDWSLISISNELWVNFGLSILFTNFDFQQDRFVGLVRALVATLAALFLHQESVIQSIGVGLVVIIGSFFSAYIISRYSRDLYASQDCLDRSCSQLFINFTEIPDPIMIIDPKSYQIIFYNIRSERLFNEEFRTK